MDKASRRWKSAGRFSLIIGFLDGLDCRVACKFLRQNTDFNQIKVISMSDAYLQETVIQQDGSGFDSILKKPFKFGESCVVSHESRVRLMIPDS